MICMVRIRNYKYLCIRLLERTFQQVNILYFYVNILMWVVRVQKKTRKEIIV